MKKLWNVVKVTMFGMVMAVALAACGGGDGTTPPAAKTISGTAAAGAPIIGTVYLKDSKGVVKSVAVDATSNGKYSFDVSDMTAPFVMKAVGTVGSNQVTYCSAATADDLGKNVNITPFTDLIVATIAGEIASNYYGNGDASKITTTALTTQVQALANKLAPVLQSVGLGVSTDLLRMSFTPGTSGLDSVMDVVKVSIDPATTAVTITNVIDNSTLTSSSLTTMSTGGMGSMTGTLTTVTTTQLTDIAQINAGIQNFVKTFATSIPTSGSAAYTALYNMLDPAFMDSGRNRDNFVSEMTASGDALGITAGPATFISTTLDSSNNITAAVVEFVVTQPKPNNRTETSDWRFRKTNGVWYPMGNGRILSFDFGATAYHNQSPSPNNTSKYGTGLQLSIADDYNSSGVAKVLVTGPGLPQNGLYLYNQQANTSSPTGSHFTIDPSGANMNNVYWLAQDTAAHDTSIMTTFSGMNDSNIPYTATLYDASNVQKAQYTIKVSKRPYTYAELATAPFATLTAPATYADLANFQLNVAQTITWTMVAGTTADWINVNIYGANNANVSYNKNLLPGQTTLTDTLTASFTPQGGSVYLTVDDQYMRMLSTSIGN